jgi:hypothetical protein
LLAVVGVGWRRPWRLLELLLELLMVVARRGGQIIACLGRRLQMLRMR